MVTPEHAEQRRDTSYANGTRASTCCESLPTCIFCKIIRGELPSIMLDETELSYAFLALPPVTAKHLHALVIPKYHAAKMHDVPDDYLADVIILAKKIAQDYVSGDYNIIQNNGKLAYQTVDHVHFHVIPKPGEHEGLVVEWPPSKSPKELEVYRKKVFAKYNVKGKTKVEFGNGVEWP